MIQSLRRKIKDTLFVWLFGPVDIDCELYTNSDEILILELVAKTKRGSFAFPMTHIKIPAPGSGVIIDSELGTTSANAGVIDEVGSVLKGTFGQQETPE